MSQRILLSGSSGLVGSRFRELANGEATIVPLVRSGQDGDGIAWDIPTQSIGDVSGFDAVVHLAGENIAGGRWNAQRKERIRSSRVDGTTLLCEALARAERKPRVLVQASAVGIYGDRDDEVLTEQSAAGSGFLAEVATAWEEASRPALDAGIRVVWLRLGVVLSKDGGALAAMRTPFRFGAGGVIGSGSQWWSWIHVDDVVRAIRFAIDREDLEGAANLVAPEPVTNREFTKALGRVVSRPTVLPLPAFAARLVLGEMADHLLLASTRVVPERLVQAGFEFEHEELEPALEAAMGR